LVINALQLKNIKNITAQLEDFADNFVDLIFWLRSINFL
jgi:hypothetical protein